MDCKQSPSDDAAQYDLNFGPIDPGPPNSNPGGFDPQASDLRDSDLQDSDLQDSDLEDSDLEGDTLREECGVFGIFGHPDAAAITALGLHALQHRGQEAAG